MSAAPPAAGLGDTTPSAPQPASDGTASDGMAGAPGVAADGAPAASRGIEGIGGPAGLPPVRPSARFMRGHLAHWIALGFGSGLSPWAPGTVGTLWAWAAFVVLDLWLDDRAWALLLSVGTLAGWWACTRTAQHLRIADPGAIVWDEVLAFWLMLWLLMPASLLAQAVAFALFRVFDAAKPGLVGWADRRFKLRPGEAIGWRQGFGILVDDLVAALCALLVIALWRQVAS